MYPPINKQVAYSVEVDCPVSNLVGVKGLLASASQLTTWQINKICDLIKSSMVEYQVYNL